jgi:mono/diheme cytochrome c family protein
MKRLLIAGSLLFVSLPALASADQKEGSHAVLAAISRAPAKARDRKNPYEGQPEAIAAGKKLFQEHCSECHGDDARGRGRAADLRASVVQDATPGELAWFLRSGNLAKGMPAWGGLPEERRWQIVAYLKSLGPATSADSASPRHF